MHHLGRVRDREDILRRVRSLRADDMRHWGRMDAGEMVRHLCGAFRGAMGEIAPEKGSVPPQPLPPATLKFLALRVPVRWPRDVPTVRELVVGAPAMQGADFARDTADLPELVERFAQPEQPRGDHPMFGAMRYWDWMRWGYLHTDHHLRQFGR